MAKINAETAARYALHAMYAEDMFDPNSQVLDPPLDARIGAAWQCIGYLTAANALLGAQSIGLGDRVYYGFVIRSTTDPTQHIAVIRGTEAVVEWLENVEGLLVNGPPHGMVEHGFYSIYDSMLYCTVGAPTIAAAPTRSAAQSLVATIPAGAVLTVIGHSLGAALATYLMADVARLNSNAFTVIGALFASPKAGDATYVKDVDQVVGPDNYVVYNYIRDIVPHVPPSLPFGQGFQALPQAMWINPVKAQAEIRNDPFCNHHAYCYAAMLDFTAVQVIDPSQRPCVLGKN